MAHKSLIGDTVYEKYGGTDLIDGTVYAKNYGKTLVGGTVYEVGFGPSEATVTITGDRGNTTITINGVVYDSGGTVVVPIGTVITCYADNDENSTSYGIYLNGVHVALTTYAYTITCNVHIETKEGGGGGYVYITEIPEGHIPVEVIIPASSGRYVQIDGATYTDRLTASGTYAVFERISVMVKAQVTGNAIRKAYVYLNGELVATSTGADPTNIKEVGYTLQVAGYSKVKVEYLRVNDAYNCYITALLEGQINFKLGTFEESYDGVSLTEIVDFTAEEGMTWEEWVSSEYNRRFDLYGGYYMDSGITIAGNSVKYWTYSRIFNEESLVTPTLSTDVIIASHDYYSEP